MEPALRKTLEEVDIGLDRLRVSRIDTLMALWGRYRHVINITGSEELGEHVVEAALGLALGRQLARGEAPWLDVGSGGGFPGLVWAAMDVQVVLMEPRSRKAAFLRRSLAAIGRPDVEVVESRFEESDLSERSWGVISSRAVWSPDEWLNRVRAWRADLILVHVGVDSSVAGPEVGRLERGRFSVRAFRVA